MLYVTLTHLGQCDPFEATVDAAIFVARKRSADFQSAVSPTCSRQDAVKAGAATNEGVPGGLQTRDTADCKSALRDGALIFIQARPRKTADGKPTRPDKTLETLPPAGKLTFPATTKLSGQLGEAGHAAHGPHDTIRVHRVPAALYRAAHKRAFFEPRPGTLRLFEKFNDPVKQLVNEWWERIETSQKFADNTPAIRAYQKSLKPGDITLVGLVAEGGQGMRTANNARFLGFLAGTPQADNLLARRETWTKRWLADTQIRTVFLGLLAQHGGDANKPTKDSAAWEAFKAGHWDSTRSSATLALPW